MKSDLLDGACFQFCWKLSVLKKELESRIDGTLSGKISERTWPKTYFWEDIFSSHRCEKKIVYFIPLSDSQVTYFRFYKVFNSFQKMDLMKPLFFIHKIIILWLLPIRNTVNTRLFGAYKPEKIIFDLSHYAKSRPAWKTGGFFAWIDGKEAQK